MLILGVDVETTGLSPEQNRITEMGCVLWDWDLKAPVHFYNAFIKSGVIVPPEITRLTGITTEMLDLYGIPEETVATETASMIQKADYICAHNAPFDRAFMKAMFTRCERNFPEIGTIDTSVDVPYPETITTRKLVHLAAEHGFVNPFAHRAVTDVLTMLQIISKYDLNEIISSASIPNITVTPATKNTFPIKDFLKANGFRWNDGTKLWTKNIKLNMFMQEQHKCEKVGFAIQEIENV